MNEHLIPQCAIGTFTGERVPGLELTPIRINSKWSFWTVFKARYQEYRDLASERHAVPIRDFRNIWLIAITASLSDEQFSVLLPPLFTQNPYSFEILLSDGTHRSIPHLAILERELKFPVPDSSLRQEEVICISGVLCKSYKSVRLTDPRLYIIPSLIVERDDDINVRTLLNSLNLLISEFITEIDPDDASTSFCITENYAPESRIADEGGEV